VGIQKVPEASGSNGKESISSTNAGTEVENQYTLPARYAVESSLPHCR